MPPWSTRESVWGGHSFLTPLGLILGFGGVLEWPPAPAGEGARPTLVSARNCPDLIAYREEIPVQHECACIADVDGGQLRHPSEACPPEAVPAGTDAGAPVPLQPGLRRMRQNPVPRPRPEAPVDPRGVLPGSR